MEDFGKNEKVKRDSTKGSTLYVIDISNNYASDRSVYRDFFMCNSCVSVD